MWYYIISVLIVIIFYILMYIWITELEKQGCNCSELWHRDIIKYSSIILLVNVILLFSNVMQKILQHKKLNNLESIWLFGSSFITITFFSILLDYIIKLKSLENCICSEDWKRELGFYYSILYFAMLGINILVLFILAIFLVYFNMKK